MTNEIEITEFFKNAAPKDYSASVAEIGENAGQYTWQAACDDSDDWNMLDTDEKRDEFRKFVKSSGGWTEEEIAAWSDKELNALFIQWVSGDMRECGLDGSDRLSDSAWEQYEELAERGTVPSNLFRTEDNNVYFYVGS